MKIKFNKFERIAGLFVLTAVIGSVAVTVGVAVQKGWFSTKVPFTTTLKSADGLYDGTVVQVAGLRAGSVTSVELISANEVKVQFQVREEFHKRIREDSYVQVVRPFIIGEKVVEVSVGSEEQPILQRGREIANKDTVDIMDLFSGRKLAPFLGTMEGMVTSLKVLADAFADERRSKAFVEMFDRLNPLIKNLDRMSKEVTKVTRIARKRRRLDKIMINLAKLTTEINSIVPVLKRDAPDLIQQIPQLVENLADLTEEFKKLTPAIGAVAPELPRASRRAIEALDEAVIVLKALQKNFFFSGDVEDVRAAETKRRLRRMQNREPTSTKPQDPEEKEE